MKVYIVQKIQKDPECNEYYDIECIFSTKELADEFVNFEITGIYGESCYIIEEFNVLDKDTASTKFKKERL